MFASSENLIKETVFSRRTSTTNELDLVRMLDKLLQIEQEILGLLRDYNQSRRRVNSSLAMALLGTISFNDLPKAQWEAERAHQRQRFWTLQKSL